jgi:hypothetical protein
MATNEMSVTAFLCDAAQESNGKLYTLGAGWSIVRGMPITMALAVKIAVPWNEANRRHVFSASLVTEDGGIPRLRVADTEQQQSLDARGEFEVGRPPGLKEGTPLDAAVAITFAGVPLLPGRYVWKLAINDLVLEEIPFSVLA